APAGTAPFASPPARIPDAAPRLPPPYAAAPALPPERADLQRLGAASAAAEPARVPEPRDVLEALQIAGIFERGSAAGERPVGWDRPERRRRRVGGLIAVIGLTVLFVAGGGGVFLV